jgi:hypothetical protein
VEVFVPVRDDNACDSGCWWDVGHSYCRGAERRYRYAGNFGLHRDDLQASGGDSSADFAHGWLVQLLELDVDAAYRLDGCAASDNHDSNLGV